MTDQIPTRYDNYPTASPGRTDLPVPAEPPGPFDPIPPRHDRRWMLGSLAGLAVGVGVAVWFGGRPQPQAAPTPFPSASEPPIPSAEPTAEASSSPVWSEEPTTEPSSSPAEQMVRVGSHSASVPLGWTVERNEANEVVLTRGTNRVDAYTFVAEEGDRAADLIAPLTRQRVPGFTATLRTIDSYAIDVGEYVQIAGRGKLGGKEAKVSAVLWIDGFFGEPYSEALLLVKVVTSISGSEESAQADHLSRQFAYDLALTGLG